MVVPHKLAIKSVISLGRFVFPKLSWISKRLIISISDKAGVLLISWMVKLLFFFWWFLGGSLLGMMKLMWQVGRFPSHPAKLPVVVLSSHGILLVVTKATGGGSMISAGSLAVPGLRWSIIWCKTKFWTFSCWQYKLLSWCRPQPVLPTTLPTVLRSWLSKMLSSGIPVFQYTFHKYPDSLLSAVFH